jgi:hypothetical protein
MIGRSPGMIGRVPQQMIGRVPRLKRPEQQA